MTLRTLAAAVLAAILVIAIAAAAWTGLRRAGGPEFQPFASYPGFRILASGSGGASGAGAALIGLGEDDRPAAPSPAELCGLIWSAPGVPAQGPADAHDRVAVFSDANCPWCRRLDEIVVELAQDRPDLRLVHHEWAVLGEGSRLAARATLAANEQGAAEPMRRRLLAARFVITPAYVAQLAVSLGLDPDRLARDMASRRVDAALAATHRAAGALGFAGTPVVVVGGTVAVGAVSRADLDRLLALEAERPDAPCR
ncbi:DsbA family protein [Albimonas sp. CAU 1670]|uniref:DsbA family protein n=1 Tax=Albimonas sp. CAU 1670 TaxID=3032599 RepID=UPI0023DC4CE1|nr:DsbA family protein [Albimonas sp. CAU 1670]MDF2232911.1 DsbA family protein [Albimonas sp. CAU 1670]